VLLHLSLDVIVDLLDLAVQLADAVAGTLKSASIIRTDVPAVSQPEAIPHPGIPREARATSSHAKLAELQPLSLFLLQVRLRAPNPHQCERSVSISLLLYSCCVFSCVTAACKAIFDTPKSQSCH